MAADPADPADLQQSAVYRPPCPFPDPAALPITALLEANYLAIKAEAARFLEIPFWSGWRPYVEPDSYQGEGRWEVFSLYGGGRKNEPMLRHCPVTASILSKVPHLRQALFSSLSPHTEIKPHRGAPGILRVHLTLMAEPGRAGWRADGQTRECVEGRVVIFEDGCLHSAWNRASSHRITLLFDTPAPQLGAQELAEVMRAYDQQMNAGRPASTSPATSPAPAPPAAPEPRKR